MGNVGVLVTAMHRSGSTHLANTLAFGLKGIYMPGFLPLGTSGDDAHMIPFFTLQYHASRMASVPFIFHGHYMGSSGNVAQLNMFGLEKVIVTTRNVTASLSSVYVAHKSGSQMPNVHVGDTWEELDEGERMMWLVRNLGPWMLSFYMTWKNSGMNTLFVNYSDHYMNEAAGNERIAEYLGVPEIPLYVGDRESDRVITGVKPVITTEMIDAITEIARTWGSKAYYQMLEDGIV